MTITGGSALPKDDIERMMREAEQYAEEDRKRRDTAEARNQADSLVYSTEKFLADSGDKVPDDIKGEVQSALGDVKKALEADDIDAIKRTSDHLATVSQKVGQAIYAENPAGAAGAGPAGDTGQSSDDEVVDAEIVDEPGDGSQG